ncbi:GuaB3 family IMP dehydrogenase-related protein [Corynebacterium sp. HS2168-gen11]|uniref:GuaB3 family IMP dehydrogenase-related protein n=1 Tax=Corynebacterium sp. HS2168-gen11 TaxID=2974027 RepID=UPI00216B29E9|nr:GuaB3 family IMP dehydrogenase-related protein [Corynebacterium sp. HS2168-gen11]MCS4535629.1 GuaB3 family IMP dehydrogenase-related protein [Corynebacterium sp. HS2168-gen11]
MRDYIDIGIGREARRTYHLRDVSVLPARRTRSSKDVDTTWHIDAYTFDFPIVTEPTDPIGSPDFIIEMGKQGGLGVLNAEGILARHEDYQAAIDTLIKGWDENEDDLTELQKLHAAPIQEELLVRRIKEIRESGVTVAVRVSPQRARELAPIVIKAGAEILFIQGTIISAEHVASNGEPLNLKEFISSLEVPVIVGGVSDYSTALHMMRTGAAGVIVGSTVEDYGLSLGISPAMATAIADVAAARRDYLDETGGRYVHVLAASEMDHAGTMITALACGADALMIGSLAANTAEAPGKGFYWPSVLAHPNFPRGSVQPRDAFAGEEPCELPSLQTVLHGNVTTVNFGTQNLVGAIRRAVAKCGYSDLKSFQKVDLSVSM